MGSSINKEICIGLDIGGTNIVLGFIDRMGNVIKHFKRATNPKESPELFVANICRWIFDCIGDLQIKCMGIAAPNGNCCTGAVHNAPNLSWEGEVPLAALFQEALHIPVSLSNDANAAAWGEKMYGVAKDTNDFVAITLGTGLGCGIVSNGLLLTGHYGLAGEFGHQILVPNGRSCSCGRKGCLEQYVSATALCYTYKELCARGKQNVLFSRSEKVFTAYMIYEAALKGDDLALEAFQITANHFGLALANLVALCNPKQIVLLGGLSRAGDILMKPLEDALEMHLWHIYKGKVIITRSSLAEDHAAILGAAAMAWEETIDI